MAIIEKQGVMWEREFKNKKTGFKMSINKEIYIAYRNTKKDKQTDPDYVIVKFVDSE